MFVGTRLRENPGRNPRRVPEHTPWARTMLQPLHPYGTILNLDIIDFRNTEKLIDYLEGSVKIGWDNTPEDTKANILAGDSKSAIAERLGRLIKIHFIGDGYFEGREKAREYAQALFGLELRSICAVDEYIYWFHKYFFQSGVATDVAAPIFFAKICSPWREMLIQSYKVPEGQLDFIARRMSFLKDKLKDWCYQASIQKNMKRLRGTIKRTPLCCDNNNFPTIIGESSEPRKRKKQNNDSYPRSSRRTPFRRRSWWSKSKARTYKSEQRAGPTRASSQGSRRTDTRSTGRTPTRRTFRRAHTRANESFKDCNCWTCGAKGHISPDCLQKRGELRKLEATNDILDAVYYGDLVPIYQFEDIPSDESVYEEEIETDSDGGFKHLKACQDSFQNDGEFAIPMELTGNVMEMQLIPKEEILEELSKLREEVAVTMKWIHIGASDVVIKATFKEGIDSEIHLSIMDRRINNLRDGCLGTMIGNLYAGKLMFDIHLRIAYNLVDQDFSRVLTLHQDFKRKDLMKEGNRPYSITYRIAYALSNTHHSDLFLRKEYIEIPRIFKEFAKVAGKENGSMNLGLNFLEDHKPWRRKDNAYIDSESGICTAKPGVFPKEAMETLPVIAGRNFSQKILILNKGIREAKIMIGGAFGSPWFRGLIESDSFYEKSEKEIINLKEALQEIKSLDISEESKLSLENVKRLIQRNFSENPLAWWDRNKIEATLKVKEECNSPGFLVRNHGEIKRGKPRERLVLSEKKATIDVNKIKFLGILIDEIGIELQEHIVEKIHNFPDVLKDKKHLQSFLGVVNFAGIFIKNLAKYRKDFQPLLKETESSKWKWEEIHTQRVRELK
ncbi:UNVERIFIED_CONTAM: movement protein [Sesamum latifolium]|uniref:Movement protein n=1 Tax=Sesamum latifolium TaxID=2727402 RepID=A0AAW2WBB2_9LAMI